METNKAIEIYLPNIADSLNKELLAKRKEIADILKGTPFEKDAHTIFEHLVKVQGALHKSESDMVSRKQHLKEDLDVIKTLLALHTPPDRIELRCFLNGTIGLDVNLPQTIIKSISLQIKDAAIKLFNQSPYLFCGKDGNILSPTNNIHLKAKERDIEKQIKELNTIRENSGKATYTKDTPNKVTDTFRMLCAIKVFCNCDGFKEWRYRGGKTERNKCIFDCLQVFGYTTIKNTTDAIGKAAQRNYEKNRISAAKESNIVFISPPL